MDTDADLRQSSIWNPMLSRRQLLGRGLGVGAGLVGATAIPAVLAACGGTPAPATGGGAALLKGPGPVPMAKLIAGAKKEGHLTTIALPPDWANYKALLAGFTSTYGIPINNQAPDDSSGQELTAVKLYKSGNGPEPDAVDVGPSFAVAGMQENLWARYKNSQWDTVPENMKDPQGYWCGDYYGVIAFGANTKVVKTVPTDWSDLLRPEYRNMVGLNGNPLSAQAAFMAVWAAALANGGSLDNILPGIHFFAELKRRGNYVAAQETPANISHGTTPIAIDWDYLLLGDRDTFAGNPPFSVQLPQHGVIGGFYCQAVSAYSTHPYAARLWEEYVYSDAGQLDFLAGYAHPVRYQDLAQRGKIPAALAAKLPPASGYASAQFPTLAQSSKAAAVMTAQWATIVLGA
ncbi:MAG TPA: ABC transporter substrate-binding protein [Candidatus Dormibacteraeota bacterium]|nr:ABC transporter substrate-binding protein [Candidatus Dormibacteraeota bacterium]